MEEEADEIKCPAAYRTFDYQIQGHPCHKCHLLRNACYIHHQNLSIKKFNALQ